MRIRTLVFLALMSLAVPRETSAQSVPLPAWTGEAFPAIGRTFNPKRPNSGFCTGTLVAPNVVLTAAHCANAGNQNLLFVLGDPQDADAKRRRIVKAMPHPSYTARGMHGPAQDLGLLVLESAFADVAPLVPGALKREPAALIGFHKFSPGALAGKADCPLQQTAATFVRFGCPVASGNSGSPLLQKTEGGWSVVAVASSQSGRSVLAPPVDDWVRSELERLTQ